MDTLSRLKGIETQLFFNSRHFIHNTLDTLSRLKGIETCWYPYIQVYPEYVPLDPLSRLKGIETKTQASRLSSHRDTLDTLSRLKGIETH